ncbi:hypothetical protein CO174_04380 [Candidatus Uhrbacteria bacterium CG_4_9_14_3_um_filter_50_9]|uniref:DUF5666 domain-containing protein n=1 Tax=Candidatus Uhrbacteria bacterium CG_4_9_14_3_um_filter_50_9 TaxID=1975035 RepID=A0A2M7XBH7_9BACT|nr:MAG: hypothetical protein CO174_04380 [Candidatus Uhrbacteria bacterium CG_4_9_14_3_um_filter_50_9]
MSKTLVRSLRFPLALAILAIVAVVLSPVFFASAAESEGQGPHKSEGPRPHHPIGEIVEIDTDANTILVGPVLTPEDEEVKYVLISYSDDTEIEEDGEEATESDISVGDKIHARGEHTFDSENYLAEINAEFIVLFDQTEPPVPPRHGFPRLGEVVEVDTDANTVLVKGMRPNEDGEDVYVLVTYGDDTVINEDGETVDESSISEGDLIRAHGEVNTDSVEYLAEIAADNIRLWDEKEPPRPGHGHGPQGQFRSEPAQEIEE